MPDPVEKDGVRRRLSACSSQRDGAGNHELHLSYVQILLQHAGVEGELLAASASTPHGHSTWQLADRKHGFHVAGRGEIGGKVFLGVAGKSHQAFGGKLLGRDAQIVSLAKPSLRVPADPENSRPYRRFALHVVQRVIGRGVGSGAVHSHAQRFAEGDIVAAKIIHLSVERDAQRLRRAGQGRV